MQESLAAAVELHQFGQLSAAAVLYQKVLTQDQSNADALHLLGVLHHQQGDHARAIELMNRAAALQPNVPACHANLAEAYRALGDFERASGCCRAALRLWPDYPEAHCNLGLALRGLGRHAEAADSFSKAVALRPEFANAQGNLGIVLRNLGKLEEALRHFRLAMELEPNSASAQTNLSQILLDLGKPAEALPHCEAAVRLQPAMAELHHNLGNVLRDLDRAVEAKACYLEGIRLEPNLAPAHMQLGLMLQREARFAEALPWLKQAAELEPNEPDCWEKLAELHGEREDAVAAISCWERVLSLAPKSASAHVSLGWLLQEEGRLADAGDHYRQAARVQPDCAAAHLNLGGLAEEQGELVEAEASFREALRLLPAYALPHARLATLLRGKLPETDEAALETRLAATDLAPGVRARLLFGLAHVVDARGDYARAASLLKHANALVLEAARGRKEYAATEHAQFVDSLVRVFTAEFFQLNAKAGLETRRPIFIFGLPRSGTTLIEQVLASHPNIHGAGELRLSRQSFEAMPGIVGSGGTPLECVAQLDAASIRRLGERHLEALGKLDDGRAERIVDKMPDNYLYLGFLATLFPQAVFIHCRRDLRDVAVSCWMTDFRSIRWANNPEHIGLRFAAYRRLMDHWRAVLPVAIHEVDYEETVTDLEGTARRLLTACGQDWNSSCLDFHQTQRPVRTASVAQVRQPVYRRSVARWKNYEKVLPDLFAALPNANSM